MKANRLLIAAFAMLISSPALTETIIGQASVIDGDTLEIHGQRIRLSGIDAPESDQLCRGDDSLQYRFGAKTANELDDHIAGSQAGSALFEQMDLALSTKHFAGERSMFDFEHWCSWVEAQCRQMTGEQVTLDFQRGQPSPKQGATVNFKANRKLMQLAFWKTGEADFYGIDLSNGSNVVGFSGRLLDDRTFEQTFRECLSDVT